MNLPIITNLSFTPPVLKTCASNLLSLALAIVPMFGFSEGVIQPVGDKRKFETLVLANDMKVLLISDPDTEKSAASIDVMVGSGDDPEDRPGLAHFLEHMLFLGTAKYPKAGEYQDFIAGHGGKHNAYTSLDHTNYFFDVDNKHFEQALDRFAQFFMSPLFDEKYVERERNAVHSEFSAKTKNDLRRQRDAFSELVVEGHPLSHFSVGNLDTLAVDSPRPLRKDLMDFYQQYYSSNRMALVLVSNMDMGALRSLAKAKFSTVEKRKAGALNTSNLLFSEDFLPARLSIQPVREIRKVSFMFPVPESKTYYATKPLGYIGFFIGHEGKGSLLASLKGANWATGLSSGLSASWRGGEVFSVSVTLTEEGLNHIADIRNLVFEYIELLERDGVERWRFEEISAVEDARFKYSDNIDPIRQASYLASDLHDIPAKDLLRHRYQFSEYKPELIRQYLSRLNRENFLEVLVAPNAATDKLSHYYATSYGVSQISPEELRPKRDVLSTAESLRNELRLPAKNKFVADDFDIINVKDNGTASQPEKLLENDSGELWFANDNVFELPKGMFDIRYKLPSVEKSAKHLAVAKLFCAVMKEELIQASYDANMAGLAYSVSATSRGLDLSFWGFNDSLDELAREVFRSFGKYQEKQKYHTKINAKHFYRVKAELLRAQKNIRYATPYQQVMREIPNYLYDPFWSVEDLVEAYESITLSEYEEIIHSLFDNASLKALVFGNYSQKAAKKLAKLSESLLPKKNESNPTMGKVIDLSKAKRQYWSSIPVDHKDHVLAIYLQGKDDSIGERAKMQLLAQILSAPFYNTLRTERQLGYIVSSFNYPLRKVPGLVLLIQSPTHNSVQLAQEINEFLNTAGETLFSQFERDRSALVMKLMEKAKSQSELKSRLWSAILKEDYNFEERELLAKAVEAVNVEQIGSYFSDLVASGASRFILSTEVDQTQLPEGIKLLENYLEFKRQMPAYKYP